MLLAAERQLGGAIDQVARTDGRLFVGDFSGVIYAVDRVVEPPDTVEVLISNYHFAPATLVVPEGTTVRWVNEDVLGLPHVVESQASVRTDGTVGDGSEIDSPTLGVGDAHSFRFDRAGTPLFRALGRFSKASNPVVPKLDGFLREVNPLMRYLVPYAPEFGAYFSKSHQTLQDYFVSGKRLPWWAIMGSIAQGVTRLGHHDLMESIWRK